jgi:hypothetical protein
MLRPGTRPAKLFSGPNGYAAIIFPARSGTSQKYFRADLRCGTLFFGPITGEAKIFPARPDPLSGRWFRWKLWFWEGGSNNFSGPIGYAPDFFLTRSLVRRKIFWRNGRCGKNIFGAY